MSHNLEIVTDANGTKTTNVYDPKNRLTARAVVPGAGVVGPLSESYAYDGLDRTTSASSGTVSTDLTYDSASRLLTDTTLGRTVAYGYDEVHNRIKTTYPSGHVVDIAVDVLDRPDTVTVAGAGVPAVDYGYRGPWLRQKSTYANGLEGTSSFDATWRPTQTTVGVPAAPAAAFEETLAWSPRSLKSAVGLGDAAGRGYVLEHDGAQRVKRAAISSSAAAMANNSVPNLPIDPSRAFDYSYDAAQNLLGHTSVNAGAETPFALPNDASGRNRPGSAGGTALGYDANGNRSADSGRQLRYDFRNRLTEVRDASGALIASYTYDAFNRRVRKDVVGQPVEEMVYAGWQELERYVVGAQGVGTLDQRYTRGTGIDEIVRMEADVDANGSLETAWTPIYDHTGNLVKLTGGAGEVVARYDYSPFGEAFTAHSDLVAPEAQLIAVDPAAGRITINVDHEARLDQAAVVIEDLTPPPLSLSVPGAKAAGILTRSISRPVSEGPVAGRRFEIDLDALPAEGTPMRLTVPAAALVDRFGNPLAADLVVDFTWPAAASGIQVLADTASPEIERIRIDQGFVEVTFSEPPAVGAASAVTINQVVPNQVIAMTWTEQVDGHTLRADTALVAGSYLLDIDSVAPVDLSGRGLSSSFQQAFEIPAAGEVEIPFERPDPTVVPPAAFVNRFAFHGRPVDEETGYVYFRNRYFDSKSGRFVSADPLGYVDGPSMYQGFLNSPLNYADPLGLFNAAGLVIQVNSVLDELVALPGDSRMESLTRLFHQPWRYEQEVADANDRYRSRFELREDGTGPTVFDEYSIIVEQVPEGMTPYSFVDAMAADLNGTVNDPIFTLLNRFDRRNSLRAPALGDIYDIDIIGPDNGSVMLVEKQPQYFVFQTVWTPELGSHPEHGAREFGFEWLEGGVLRLYTRGASRPRDLGAGVAGAFPQMVGWTRMMRGFSDFVNEHGGRARPGSFQVFVGREHALSPTLGERAGNRSRQDGQ